MTASVKQAQTQSGAQEESSQHVTETGDRTQVERNR